MKKIYNLLLAAIFITAFDAHAIEKLNDIVSPKGNDNKVVFSNLEGKIQYVISEVVNKEEPAMLKTVYDINSTKKAIKNVYLNFSDRGAVYFAFEFNGYYFLGENVPINLDTDSKHFKVRQGLRKMEFSPIFSSGYVVKKNSKLVWQYNLKGKSWSFEEQRRRLKGKSRGCTRKRCVEEEPCCNTCIFDGWYIESDPNAKIEVPFAELPQCQKLNSCYDCSTFELFINGVYSGTIDEQGVEQRVFTVEYYDQI